MIDRTVLIALATATLFQQPGVGECQIDTPALDGFEQPNELARQLLGLDAGADRVRRCFGYEDAFNFAFDFALQLGAAIAHDPSKIPDISEPLSKSRSEVRKLIDDVAAGRTGCMQCTRAAMESSGGLASTLR